MKIFKTILIFASLIVFVSSNVNCNNKTSVIDKKDDLNLLEGEWSDQSGTISFGVYDYRDTNVIYAFDTSIIRYKRLNDTLYQIFYPEKLLLNNISTGSFYDEKNTLRRGFVQYEWMSIDDFWSYDYNTKKSEITFGADNLKIKKINRNKILILFPKESYWIVKKVGDGIEICNKNNKNIKKLYKHVIG